MKYVSKENLEQYNTKLKEYITNLNNNMITEDKVKELCDDKLSNVILKDITVGKDIEFTSNSNGIINGKFTFNSTDINALGINTNKYKYFAIALEYNPSDYNANKVVYKINSTTVKSTDAPYLLYIGGEANPNSKPDPTKDYQFDGGGGGCYKTKDNYIIIYSSLNSTSYTSNLNITLMYPSSSSTKETFNIYIALFEDVDNLIRSNMTDIQYSISMIGYYRYYYTKKISIPTDSTLEADTFSTFTTKNLDKDYQSVQTYIDTAVTNLYDIISKIPAYTNNNIGENGDGIYLTNRLKLERVTSSEDMKKMFYINKYSSDNSNYICSSISSNGDSISTSCLINITAEKDGTTYSLFSYAYETDYQGRQYVNGYNGRGDLASQLNIDVNFIINGTRYSSAYSYQLQDAKILQFELKPWSMFETFGDIYVEDYIKEKGFTNIKYEQLPISYNFIFTGVTEVKDADRLKVSINNNTDNLALKSDLIDLLTYGVQWDINEGDPHLTRIGNMNYHKSLPIQNGIRGCIVQFKDGLDVKYYLDDDDFRFKVKSNYPEYEGNTDEESDVFVGLLVKSNSTTSTLIDSRFSTKKYEKQYIRVQGSDNIFQITFVDTSTSTATLTGSNIPNGEVILEIGSVTNGYDGELMLEVPEFWIKSWINGDKREVRISPTYINETWEHSPKTYISPFKDTMLISVPENMGYLSTLEVGSAICICNMEDYCKGGDTTSAGTSINGLNGKHRTNITRAEMRTAARKSGKEVMSYLQYKRILYWLYVIEYANFNCQEAYNATLTSEGFKQGGLGPGVTSYTFLDDWGKDNYNPIVPNDINYCNEGPHDVIVHFKDTGSPSTSFTYNTIYPWHHIVELFGDDSTMLDGIIIGNADKTENNIKYNAVYITDYPSNYSDTNKYDMYIAGYEVLEGGLIKEFDLGSTAEIIPKTVGGSTTTYKCDNHVIEDNNNFSNRVLIVGSDASDSGEAGIGFFNSSSNVNAKHQTIGFRTSYIVK